MVVVVPTRKKVTVVDKVRHLDENQNPVIRSTTDPDSHNVFDNQARLEARLLV